MSEKFYDFLFLLHFFEKLLFLEQILYFVLHHIIFPAHWGKLKPLGKQAVDMASITE